MLVAATWWNRFGMTVLATGEIAAILEGPVTILLAPYSGFTVNSKLPTVSPCVGCDPRMPRAHGWSRSITVSI
jgi:hypothetical protein